MASGLEIQDEDVPSCTIRIQMKSRLLLDSVKLEVHCPWPLAANQAEFFIPSIEPGTPSETFVAVFQRYPGLPAHMYVQISASYTSASGGRRVATSRANLPVKLILKPTFPVKMATHKLTVDTNCPPVNLNEIFPDLLGENASGPGAALGFQFLGGGPVVTLLASKTSQRYRLQSDRLESMWLPLRELVVRLNSHFKKAGRSDFKVTFDGSLPLQEYFELVDYHFDFRTGAVKCKELLAQRSAQFRTIQKRLLTRFKDKTPAPLQNLDTLLEGTYRQILALADAVDENAMAEKIAANNLSSGTYLLNFLLKLWMDMTEDETKVLEATLTPVVNSSDEQGWEESVDASVTHLLRTVMAKSAKDQAVNPSPLTTPPDTSKLKKHIALFCDRIGKGTRLVDGLKEKKERAIKMPVSKTIMEGNESESVLDQVPVDELLNTKNRGRKKKKKNMDGPTYGLPATDRPEAGLSALTSSLRPAPISMGKGYALDDDDVKSQRTIESLVPDLDSLEQAPEEDEERQLDAPVKKPGMENNLILSGGDAYRDGENLYNGESYENGDRFFDGP